MALIIATKQQASTYVVAIKNYKINKESNTVLKKGEYELRS